MTSGRGKSVIKRCVWFLLASALFWGQLYHFPTTVFPWLLILSPFHIIVEQLSEFLHGEISQVDAKSFHSICRASSVVERRSTWHTSEEVIVTLPLPHLQPDRQTTRREGGCQGSALVISFLSDNAVALFIDCFKDIISLILCTQLWRAEILIVDDTVCWLRNIRCKNGNTATFKLMKILFSAAWSYLVWLSAIPRSRGINGREVSDREVIDREVGMGGSREVISWYHRDNDSIRHWTISLSKGFGISILSPSISPLPIESQWLSEFRSSVFRHQMLYRRRTGLTKNRRPKAVSKCCHFTL